MENLNAALNDLTETLREEGFRDGLIEEIAADWEIKAPLLARKFEERTGKAPAEFKAASRADMRNAAIQKAMEAAIERRADFTDGAAPDICGKGFTHDGEEYIAVVIAIGGLRAIQISNGKAWKFGNSGADAIRAAQKFGLI